MDSHMYHLPQQQCDALAVARSWVGTPYHLKARIKGAGADCGTLLAEYLIECGLCERIDLGNYSHDWFCHTSNELYMLRLMRLARKTLEGIARPGLNAAPGSLALFRVAGSPVFNHGAIVTKWPFAVHAVYPKVEESDMSKHCLTAYKEVAFFDPWSLDARE